MTRTRSQVLSLYRNILQTHKRVLPVEMRSLGDKYVRAEFKAHKESDPKWLAGFFDQWENYLNFLNSQAPLSGNVGLDLDPNVVRNMNDEQKEQLARLETEARAVVNFE